MTLQHSIEPQFYTHGTETLREIAGGSVAATEAIEEQEILIQTSQSQSSQHVKHPKYREINDRLKEMLQKGLFEQSEEDEEEGELIEEKKDTAAQRRRFSKQVEQAFQENFEMRYNSNKRGSSTAQSRGEKSSVKTIKHTAYNTKERSDSRGSRKHGDENSTHPLLEIQVIGQEIRKEEKLAQRGSISSSARRNSQRETVTAPIPRKSSIEYQSVGPSAKESSVHNSIRSREKALSHTSSAAKEWQTQQESPTYHEPAEAPIVGGGTEIEIDYRSSEVATTSASPMQAAEQFEKSVERQNHGSPKTQSQRSAEKRPLRKRKHDFTKYLNL